MKNKKTETKPSPQSLSYAFKSFAMDASEKELDAALSEVGVDPEELLAKAEASINSVMTTVSNSKDGNQIRRGASNQEIALHKGLRTIIGLLRRKNGLSEQDLARAARIDIDEVMRIEFDDSFTPSPRTIYQLEEFFELPPRSLALISGAVSHRSAEFTEGVLRFAAHSKEIGGLSREERKLLNEFVRFLSAEAKKRR